MEPKTKYYSVFSKLLGNGGLWESRKDAERERLDLLAVDPSDEVLVQERELTRSEYESLPEFGGW